MWAKQNKHWGKHVHHIMILHKRYYLYSFVMLDQVKIVIFSLLMRYLTKERQY